MICENFVEPAWFGMPGIVMHVEEHAWRDVAPVVKAIVEW